MGAEEYRDLASNSHSHVSLAENVPTARSNDAAPLRLLASITKYNNVMQSVMKSDNTRHNSLKALIPAAGLGTRFLPHTKAQPKERLPILSKPTIRYVVEEALASGIHDIRIITGRGKRAIEDHFDASPELEHHLRQRGKESMLRSLNRILDQSQIAYIRQRTPLGNGHAILCAETAVGGDSFAVLLGDDVLLSSVPCATSLMRWHEKLGASCIAAQRVPIDCVGRYGMIIGDEVTGNLHRIRRIIEKPSKSQVSSNLVTLGRYVFWATIFGHLRRTRPGQGGEIWLSDSIQAMLEPEDVYAWTFPGRRYDVGTVEDWLLANLDSARSHPILRKHLDAFIAARLCRQTTLQSNREKAMR